MLPNLIHGSSLLEQNRARCLMDAGFRGRVVAYSLEVQSCGFVILQLFLKTTNRRIAGLGGLFGSFPETTVAAVL